MADGSNLGGGNINTDDLAKKLSGPLKDVFKTSIHKAKNDVRKDAEREINESFGSFGGELSKVITDTIKNSGGSKVEISIADLVDIKFGYTQQKSIDAIRKKVVSQTNELLGGLHDAVRNAIPQAGAIGKPLSASDMKKIAESITVDSAQIEDAVKKHMSANPKALRKDVEKYYTELFQLNAYIDQQEKLLGLNRNDQNNKYTNLGNLGKKVAPDLKEIENYTRNLYTLQRAQAAMKSITKNAQTNIGTTPIMNMFYEQAESLAENLLGGKNSKNPAISKMMLNMSNSLMDDIYKWADKKQNTSQRTQSFDRLVEKYSKMTNEYGGVAVPQGYATYFKDAEEQAQNYIDSLENIEKKLQVIREKFQNLGLDQKLKVSDQTDFFGLIGARQAFGVDPDEIDKKIIDAYGTDKNTGRLKPEKLLELQEASKQAVADAIANNNVLIQSNDALAESEEKKARAVEGSTNAQENANRRRRNDNAQAGQGTSAINAEADSLNNLAQTQEHVAQTVQDSAEAEGQAAQNSADKVVEANRRKEKSVQEYLETLRNQDTSWGRYFASTDGVVGNSRSRNIGMVNGEATETGIDKVFRNLKGEDLNLYKNITGQGVIEQLVNAIGFFQTFAKGKWKNLNYITEDDTFSFEGVDGSKITKEINDQVYNAFLTSAKTVGAVVQDSSGKLLPNYDALASLPNNIQEQVAGIFMRLFDDVMGKSGMLSTFIQSRMLATASPDRLGENYLSVLADTNDIQNIEQINNAYKRLQDTLNKLNETFPDFGTINGTLGYSELTRLLDYLAESDDRIEYLKQHYTEFLNYINSSEDLLTDSRLEEFFKSLSTVKEVQQGAAQAAEDASEHEVQAAQNSAGAVVEAEQDKQNAVNQTIAKLDELKKKSEITFNKKKTPEGIYTSDIDGIYAKKEGRSYSVFDDKNTKILQGLRTLADVEQQTRTYYQNAYNNASQNAQQQVNNLHQVVQAEGEHANVSEQSADAVVESQERQQNAIEGTTRQLNALEQAWNDELTRARSENKSEEEIQQINKQFEAIKKVYDEIRPLYSSLSDETNLVPLSAAFSKSPELLKIFKDNFESLGPKITGTTGFSDVFNEVYRLNQERIANEQKLAEEKKKSAQAQQQASNNIVEGLHAEAQASTDTTNTVIDNENSVQEEIAETANAKENLRKSLQELTRGGRDPIRFVDRGEDEDNWTTTFRDGLARTITETYRKVKDDDGEEHWKKTVQAINNYKELENTAIAETKNFLKLYSDIEIEGTKNGTLSQRYTDLNNQLDISGKKIAALYERAKEFESGLGGDRSEFTVKQFSENIDNGLVAFVAKLATDTNKAINDIQDAKAKIVKAVDTYKKDVESKLNSVNSIYQGTSEYKALQNAVNSMFSGIDTKEGFDALKSNVDNLVSNLEKRISGIQSHLQSSNTFNREKNALFKIQGGDVEIEKISNAFRKIGFEEDEVTKKTNALNSALEKVKGQLLARDSQGNILTDAQGNTLNASGGIFDIDSYAKSYEEYYSTLKNTKAELYSHSEAYRQLAKFEREAEKAAKDLANAERTIALGRDTDGLAQLTADRASRDLNSVLLSRRKWIENNPSIDKDVSNLWFSDFSRLQNGLNARNAEAVAKDTEKRNNDANNAIKAVESIRKAYYDLGLTEDEVHNKTDGLLKAIQKFQETQRTDPEYFDRYENFIDLLGKARNGLTDNSNVYKEIAKAENEAFTALKKYYDLYEKIQLGKATKGTEKIDRRQAMQDYLSAIGRRNAIAKANNIDQSMLDPWYSNIINWRIQRRKGIDDATARHELDEQEKVKRQNKRDAGEQKRIDREKKAEEDLTAARNKSADDAEKAISKIESEYIKLGETQEQAKKHTDELSEALINFWDIKPTDDGYLNAYKQMIDALQKARDALGNDKSTYRDIGQVERNALAALEKYQRNNNKVVLGKMTTGKESVEAEQALSLFDSLIAKRNELIKQYNIPVELTKPWDDYIAKLKEANEAWLKLKQGQANDAATNEANKQYINEYDKLNAKIQEAKVALENFKAVQANASGTGLLDEVANAAENANNKIKEAENALTQIENLSKSNPGAVTEEMFISSFVALDDIMREYKPNISAIPGILGFDEQSLSAARDLIFKNLKIFLSTDLFKDTDSLFAQRRDALQKSIDDLYKIKPNIDTAVGKELSDKLFQSIWNDINERSESVFEQFGNSLSKFIDKAKKKFDSLGLLSTEAAEALDALKNKFTDLDVSNISNKGWFDFFSNIRKEVSGVGEEVDKIRAKSAQAFLNNEHANDYKNLEAMLNGPGINYSALQKAKTEVDELRSKLEQGEISTAKYAKSYDQIVGKFRNVISATTGSAEQNRAIMENWVRTQANGADVILKWGKNNEKLTGTFKNQNDEIVKVVANCNMLQGTISGVVAEQKKAQSGIGMFFDSLSGKWTEVIRYFATFGSIYRVFGELRKGISVIKEYDKALTEMNKVSNDSFNSLRNFQQESFALADAVGVTASTIQNSAADWMRLGESLNQAKESAQQSAILFNVSEFQDIGTATDALVSASQAYQELDKSDIVDKINYIGNNYAIATDGLASALQRSAAVLKTQGNDIDEAIALLTAGNSIIQNPEMVAAGIRTISLRIAGTEEAKGQLAEVGEDVDDFIVQTHSKTQQLIKDYTAVASNAYKGVDVLDPNGNLRDTYEILRDISKVYKEIQETDKKAGTNRANALVEALAGKNRSNIAASILNAPELLENVYRDSKYNSQGSAQEELDKQLASIEGHVNQVKNKFDELWFSTVNRDTINFFVDLGGSILDVANDVGVLATAVMGISGLFTMKSSLLGNSWLNGGLSNLFNTNAHVVANQIDTNVVAALQTNIAKGIPEVDAMAIAMQRANQATQEYLKTAGASASVNEAVNINMNMAAASTNKFANVLSNVVSVAGTVVKTLANMAISMAIAFAVTKGIELISKRLYEQTHQLEILDQKAKDAKSTIDTLNASITDLNNKVNAIKDPYAQLAQGVDQNTGENLTLTNEAYEEYLNYNNQLAELFPTMVRYYDENGNAVLNLKGNVSDLTNEIDGLVEAQRKLAQQHIGEQIAPIIDDYSAKMDGYRSQLEENTKRAVSGGFSSAVSENFSGYGTTYKIDLKDIYKAQDIVKMLEKYGIRTVDGMRPYTQMSGDLTPEQMRTVEFTLDDENNRKYLEELDSLNMEYAKKAEVFQDNIDKANQDIKNANADLLKYLSNWMNNDLNYLSLSDDMRSSIQQLLMNTDWIGMANASGANTSDEILAWLKTNYIDAMVQLRSDPEMASAMTSLFDSSITPEAKLKLAEKLQAYFDQNSIPIKLDFILDSSNKNSTANLLKRFRESLGIGKTPRSNAFIAMLDQANIKTEQEIELWLELSRKIKDPVAALREYVRLKKESSKKEPSTFLGGISSTQGLSSGFDQLDKVYKDVKDKGLFDWSQIIDNQAFTNAFGNLKNVTEEYTSAYDDFIKTVAKSPNDIAKCQEAFDNLTTAYIMNSDILSQINEENASVIQAQLEGMGVTNAEAIVTEALTYNLSMERLEKGYLANASIDLANATGDEIVAFYNEQVAAGVAKQAILDFIGAKSGANAMTIMTDGDIQNLMDLANAAQVAAAAVAAAKSAMATTSSLAAKKNIKGAYTAQDAFTENYARQSVQDAGKTMQKELFSSGTSGGFKPQKLSYGGGKKSNSGGGGGGGGKGGGGGSGNQPKETKKIYDWIERRLTTIKKQEDLVKISVEDTNSTYGDRITSLHELIDLQGQYVEAETTAQEAREKDWEDYQKKLKDRFGEETAAQYIESIMNGSIDLDNYKTVLTSKEDATVDKSTIDLMDEAIDAYDKLRDAIIDVANAQDELHDSIQEEFKMRIEELEYLQDMIGSKIDEAEWNLDMKDILGQMVVEQDYQDMIDLADEQIENYQEQLDVLNEQLDTLDEGTAEWYDCQRAISECESSIRDCVKNQAEWNDKIMRLPIERLDKYIRMLENIKKDLQNWISERDTLNISTLGKTIGEQFKIAQEQIEAYQKQEKLYVDLMKNYEYGSEKFHETADAIQSCQDNVSGLIQEMEELNMQFLKLPIDEISKANEKLQQINSAEQRVLDDYDTALSAVLSLFDKQIDKLNDQKDYWDDYYENLIKPEQEKLDLLNEQNEAKQMQYNIDKAQYDLDKARQQKNVQVIRNGRIEYDSDYDAVKNAQDNLANAQHDKVIYDIQQVIDGYEKLNEKKQEELDDEIDAYEDARNRWETFEDERTFEKESAEALRLFGEGWEKNIINRTDDREYDIFSKGHIELDRQITANEKQIEANETMMNLMTRYAEAFLSGEMTYEDAVAQYNKLYADYQSGGALVSQEALAAELAFNNAKTMSDALKGNNATTKEQYDSFLKQLEEANSNKQIYEAFQKSWDEMKKSLDEQLAELKKLAEAAEQMANQRNKTIGYSHDDDDDGGRGEWSKNPTGYGPHTKYNPTGSTRYEIGGPTGSRVVYASNNAASGAYDSEASRWVSGGGGGGGGGSVSVKADSVSVETKDTSVKSERTSSPSGPASDPDYTSRGKGPGAYADGLAKGMIGNISPTEKFKKLQAMGLKPLEPDEVPAFLHVGEGVVNAIQQGNILKSVANAFNAGVASNVAVQPTTSGNTYHFDLSFGDITLPDVRDVDGFARSMKMNFESAMNQQFSKIFKN